MHETKKKNDVLNDAIAKAKSEQKMHDRPRQHRHYNAYHGSHRRPFPRNKKVWTMWIPKGSNPPFGRIVERNLNPRYTRVNYINLDGPKEIWVPKHV